MKTMATVQLAGRRLFEPLDRCVLRIAADLARIFRLAMCSKGRSTLVFFYPSGKPSGGRQAFENKNQFDRKVRCEHVGNQSELF
jgi:hypothetical protein